MITIEKEPQDESPPRLLQVKLSPDVDILLRMTAVKQRRHLKDLIAEAILHTYGPHNTAGDQ